MCWSFSWGICLHSFRISTIRFFLLVVFLSVPPFLIFIDLFLKVCARYRGCGGWQPGPEIIWLLLRHEASRGHCDHHRLCSDQTIPLTLLGLHGYLRISTIRFFLLVVFLSSLLLCTQGRLSHAVNPWTLCSFISSVISCEYNWAK
jgi:hypothetical protein